MRVSHFARIFDEGKGVTANLGLSKARRHARKTPVDWVNDRLSTVC